MLFFSKNKNTNNGQNGQEGEKQKIALRTMQQDLGAAKESGDAMNAVVIESISRVSKNTKESIDSIGQQKNNTIPPAPRELPRLAEAEREAEDGAADKSFSGQDAIDPNFIAVENFSYNNKIEKEDVQEKKNAAPVKTSLPASNNISMPPAPSFFPRSDNVSVPEELLDKKNFYQNGPILNKEYSQNNLPIENADQAAPQKEEEKKAENVNVPAPSAGIDEGDRENNQKIENQAPKLTLLDRANGYKKIIAAVSLAAAAFVCGGAIFYYFKTKNNIVKNTSVKPQENTAVLKDRPVEDLEILKNPFAIFNLTDNYSIDFNSGDFDGSARSLHSILSEKISSAELKIPSFDFVNIEFSINGEFPSSEEIADKIIENFPGPLVGKIGEKYNIVGYLQGKSPRLGIILEISEKNGLEDLLKENEDSLMEILSGLYFDKSEIGKAASENAGETVYKNVVIRYKNFPIHSSAADYAILDNFLIFSTSKDSMFKIVDLIKEKISADQPNDNKK